jgi:hypothetical protein
MTKTLKLRDSCVEALDRLSPETYDKASTEIIVDHFGQRSTKKQLDELIEALPVKHRATALSYLKAVKFMASTPQMKRELKLMR